MTSTKRRIRTAVRGGSAALMTAFLLTAAAAGAEDIELRTDCTGSSVPLCFTDLASVLAEIHQRPGNGRTPPGPTHPVAVDIGAGVFPLTSTTYPYCDGLSHISFRGAGKDVTVLTGGGYPNQPGFFDFFGPYVVLIRNCSAVDFSHLMIRTDASTNSGVRFAGSGGTWWSSVRMVITHEEQVQPVVWLDAPIQAQDTSTHHWTDVQAKISGVRPSGFWITGSRHEFRASHIRVESSGGVIYGGVYGSGQFDLSFEGSLVEMIDDGASSTIAAFWFTNANGFYPSCSEAVASIAGSDIRGATTATGGSLAGIVNYCQNFQGSIQGRGNTYSLDGANTVRRIGGSQAIDAPHHLGAGANPPPVGSAWSRKGMETFWETDCAARCQDTPQGSDVHELVFDPGCSTAGPWLDRWSGLCRGM